MILDLWMYMYLMIAMNCYGYKASVCCSSELNSFSQDKEPEYADFSQEDYEDPIMNKLLQTEGHWLTMVRIIFYSC